MGVVHRKLLAAAVVLSISPFANSLEIPKDAKQIIDRINANWDSKILGYCDSAKPFSQSYGCYQIIKKEDGNWTFELKEVSENLEKTQKSYRVHYITDYAGTHKSAALAAGNLAFDVNGLMDDKVEGHQTSILSSPHHRALQECVERKTTSTQKADRSREIVGENIEIDPIGVWIGFIDTGWDQFLTIHDLAWGAWRSVEMKNIKDGEYLRVVKEALVDAIIQNRLVRLSKKAGASKGVGDPGSTITLEITDKQVPKGYDNIKAMNDACRIAPAPVK